MSYQTDNFDARLLELLKNGAVGFMPSDTIYGLSCRALDEEAVKRLHRLKRRDKTKPFIVLISKMGQLAELGVISNDAGPVLRYWPGKLTVICDAPYSPAWLNMGLYTLAVRQPDSVELRELIEKTGPIVSTSANIQGGEPAKSVAEAKKYFGDRLDFYVNGGKLSGRPSTIVKPVFDKLKIIREGAVKIKRKDLL